MAYGFLDIATTPAVRAAQEAMGSAALYDKARERGGTGRRFDRFGEQETAFIAARDSFYMASVSETGWPYVQHRGGAAGFLKPLDERTLAFADYRGNRQYISLGNLSAEPRVCLFLIDYPRRARLKIYAHAEAVALDDDPELAARVLDPGYKALPERIFRLTLDAFDWNCSQHITPRFTAREVESGLGPLRARLAALEVENAALRARLETPQ